MPGQACTLHTQRKARHAAKRAKRSERRVLALRKRSEHQIMELVEYALRFVAPLSFDRYRHERCGRLRDRAALSLEADVGDRVAVQLDPQRQRVAAERIPTLDLSIRVLHLPKISRLPVVLEDQFLVKR